MGHEEMASRCAKEVPVGHRGEMVGHGDGLPGSGESPRCGYLRHEDTGTWLSSAPVELAMAERDGHKVPTGILQEGPDIPGKGAPRDAPTPGWPRALSCASTSTCPHVPTSRCPRSPAPSCHL